MSATEERLTLAVRLVIIAVLAVVVAVALETGWSSRGPINTAYQAIASALPLARPVEVVTSLLVGVYVGLVGLLIADEKRRFSGVLLGIGSVIVAGVMWTSGFLLAELTVTLPNLIGLGLGLFVVLGTLGRRLRTLSNESQTTFGRAAVAFVVSVAVILALGLVQTLAAGEVVATMYGVPTAAVALYLLIGYVQYEDQTTVAIVGPSQSGKSMLLIGMYYTIRETDDSDPDATDRMREMIDNAARLTPESRKDWPVPETRSTSRVGLWFEVGEIFPRRIQFLSFDYRGSNLRNIVEYVTNWGIGNSLSVLLKQENRFDEWDGETQWEYLAGRTRTADIVLFVVDLADLERNGNAGLPRLNDLQSELETDEANQLVVGTKADVMLDEFIGSAKSFQNPAEADMLRADGDAESESFQAFVTANAIETYEPVKDLLDATNSEYLQPVYFETRETEDGTLVPDLSDGGLSTTGMDELYEEIKDRV